MSKDDSFDIATKERTIKLDWARIPDGQYYLSENRKGFGKVDARMKVKDGAFIVLKDSVCAPTRTEWVPESRKNAPIEDNVLLDDVVCNTPSTVGWIVLGESNNGWLVWKDKDGNAIDVYRVNANIEEITNE